MRLNRGACSELKHSVRERVAMYYLAHKREQSSVRLGEALTKWKLVAGAEQTTQSEQARGRRGEGAARLDSDRTRRGRSSANCVRTSQDVKGMLRNSDAGRSDTARSN
jgi:hypothetical protein